MGNKRHPCQLCKNKAKASISIFGQKGLQVAMKSILFQHFGLQFTETDKESKIICNRCWKVTNDFHQLYCLVKDVSSISIQLPMTPKTVDNNEHSEKQLNFIDGEVKLERNEDSSPLISDDHIFDDASNESKIPNHLNSELPIKNENAVQMIADEDRIAKSEENAYQLTFKQKLSEKQVQTIEQDREIQNWVEIVCELCYEKFKTFLELKKHFKSKHKVTGYIRCCDRKYKSRTTLYDHIQYHRNPASLQCSICAKVCINQIHLKEHIKRHDPNQIQCPNCPKLFGNKWNLKKHIQWVHVAKPKSLICDICDKSFVSKLTIATHLLAVHVRKYSKICDICGQKFRSAKQLDNHYQIKHLGIQLPKVQCTVCHIWLLNKDSLRNHIRYHYAKEETCPVCGKKAPNRHAMDSHRRKVHSGHIYSCNVCDKKFKTRKTLKEHISTHTGYNLYKCKYCDMEFTYESSLYKHRRDVHSIEVEEDRTRKICKRIKKIDKMN